MQDLNFRKKRRTPGQKPRRQMKGKKLRFDDRRKKLYFEKKKGRKRAVSIRRRRVEPPAVIWPLPAPRGTPPGARRKSA